MRKSIQKLTQMAAVGMSVLVIGGCANNTASTTATTAESAAETTVAESESAKAEETTETAKEEKAETKSEATDSAWLKEYYGVEISKDGPDATAFNEALKTIAGDEAPAVEGDLNLLSAVKAAVGAADYEELALSYPADKVKERLAVHGIKDDVDEEYAAYLACALDTDLISDEEGPSAVKKEAMTQEQAESLLMRIIDVNGDGRNYLGMASDPDIYGKIDQMWNSFIIFDDDKLAEIGKNSVQQQVTTGYGIKSAAYDARFLSDLTLQYGHSDIKHAHQLIGLLNSENIDAKVQLEPKISIYQYLLEWGPIPEATPTYEVKQFDDDLYLVYAVEYDMKLEFNTTADLKRFNDVINAYAKKNEGNEEAKGLIYASWWQPLYSTTRTDMSSDDYHQIYDCVVSDGIYSIHPFALPENKDETVEKFKEFAGDSGVEVTPQERYVNTAFYNYLKGDDYQ